MQSCARGGKGGEEGKGGPAGPVVGASGEAQVSEPEPPTSGKKSNEKPAKKPASVDWCKVTTRILKKKKEVMQKKKLLQKVMKKAGVSGSDRADEWEQCVRSAGIVAFKGKLAALKCPTVEE